MIELYIDNKRVDVAQNTTLPLKWQSNIFGDLSKIVGNKSATITLPLTANNSEVFALAEIPASQGAKARQRLAARCVVDGVPVFNDGFAVLLSVSTGYEIALTWGVITNYNALVEDDTQLNEAEWITWLNGTGYPLLMHSPDVEGSENNSDWRQLIYYTEVLPGNTDANVPPFLPSVLVSHVLSQIAQHYGVTIRMPLGRQDYLNDLALLLTGTELHEPTGYISGRGTTRIEGGETRLTYTDTMHIFRRVDGSEVEDPGSDWLENTTNAHDGTIKVIVHETRVVPFAIAVYILATPQGNIYDTFPATYDGTAGIYRLDVEKTYDFTKYTTIDISPAEGYTGLISFSVEINIDGDPVVGDYYPLTSNLPAMSAIEFLKDMAARAGVTAVDASANELRFIAPDQLYTEAPQLLPDPVSVESVAFSYGDYAQRNVLRNAEDEGSNNIGEGVIVVEDTTLEHEKELYSSPLGLLNNVQNLHLYEREDEETNEYSFRDIATRIGLISGTNNAVAANTGFDYITSRYYSAMQRILRKPEVIKCSIHITLLEVVNLDIAKPVYFNRLGRRYAVLSIEMRGKDTFTFELLQL